LNVKGHPEVSVKTGTTNDLKDNWTIGYTEQVLTLTWVGNNDNTPMRNTVSGVSGASPIWNTVIGKALDKSEEGSYSKEDKGHSWPRKPQEVVGATVCNTTGNVAQNGEAGCGTRFEYFLKDKVGAQIETGRQDIMIDKVAQTTAKPDTPPENIEPQNHAFLLDPLGTLVCLDCGFPQGQVTIGFPLVPPATKKVSE
jgi:membrane peptidoglycan carboxypeptidase